MRRGEALDAAAIAALALAALALSRSGADLALSRLAFDAASGRFPLRDHWLLARVLHEGLKWAAVAFELAVLGALAFAWLRPAGRLRAWRGALAYLAIASLASAGAVTLLRGASAHSCPWDLAQFGGRFAYFPFLDAVPPDAGPGRCAPSGHASVGFMWIAAVHALRLVPVASRPLSPRRAAAIVAALGIAATATQVLRGAHFASHGLLTVAVCWAVAWVLWLAWAQAKARRELP